MEAPETELEGVGYTEGPTVTPDGRLFYTGVLEGTVGEARDGTVLREHQLGGGPSGTVLGADGTLWVVQCSGLFGAPSETPAGLYRIDGDVVAPVETERLRAPNDIVFGPDGLLYLTDPTADPTTPAGPVPAPVCSYDTATGELRTVADDLLFPNGLAFEAGGEALLVAESVTNRMLRFPWAAGHLGEPSVVCETEGAPDGLAVATDGTFWVALPFVDEVHAFDPDGTLVERIHCGEGSFPTNCCFAGPDRDVLLITVAGLRAILRVRPGVTGIELYA